MKKILINIYVFSLISSFSMVVTGCEKWFDVSSEVDLKEDEMFRNENGFFDVLIDGYSRMASSKLYGDNLTLSCLDIMAYNYLLENQAPKLFLDFAKFDYKTTDTEPKIKSIWGEMYSIIANNNKLLERLERADKTLFTGDNFNMIKGEALALRAFLHFDLARMFGPSMVVDKYKKCIPYRTVIGKDNVPYSSVQEVLEKALRDLKEAETLLSNDIVLRPMERPTNIYLMNRSLRLNLFAVKALMIRIELYKGTDKAVVYKMATDLMDILSKNINYPHFSTSPTDAQTDKLFSFELLFSLYVYDIDKTAKRYYSATTDGSNELRNSKDVLDVLFDARPPLIQDVRYDMLFDHSDEAYPRLRKFLQESGDARSTTRMPMLRLSEIYYIAAETAPDVETAQKLINRVLTARRVVSMNFENMDEIESFLEGEYRREFIGEGQLFYFYKRKNYKNIPTCQIDLSDRLSEVYVFPLPQQEIDWGLN